MKPSRPAPVATKSGARERISDTDTVPVIEERAVVRRQTVEGGRVRITKSVREREERIDEPVSFEEVRVERRPVDPPREVKAPPPVRHDGATTVIPILEERLYVEKRLVVTEELHVTRLRQGRRERRVMALRSEHLEVERMQPADIEQAEIRRGRPGPRQSLHVQQESGMERILIGVFDSKQQMEAACQELRDCGIPSDRVRIQTGNVDEQLKSQVLGRDRADDKADTGFFHRLFGGLDEREQQPDQYAEAVSRGGSVIIIDGVDENRIEQAVQVMERHGAFDIDERVSQWRAGGWKGSDARSSTGIGREDDESGIGAAHSGRSGERAGHAQMTASNMSAGGQMAGAPAQGSTRIPVVEEQLTVGKREIQRGGVRIYTRTSERPIEESVTLREERAHVERRPVDRAATQAELGDAFSERSIELSETAEEPVVSKTARVVEEVDVGKQVSSRTETIKDSVRRTDVEVEDLPGQGASRTTGQKPRTRKD